MMEVNRERLMSQYQELAQYVGLQEDDFDRIRDAWPSVSPDLDWLVEDFYAEIERHLATRSVMRGGPAQVQRLKQAMAVWIEQMFKTRCDEAFVVRRWEVGVRHVQVGLPHVYAGVAMSRLRSGIASSLRKRWSGDLDELAKTIASINRLMDLDMALIDQAYHQAALSRQQQWDDRLLETVEAAVIEIETCGTIRRCNQVATRWADGDTAGIIGQRWGQVLMVAEDRDRAAELFHRVRDGQPVHGELLRVESSSGQSRLVNWSGSAVHDEAGAPVSVICVGHDVTALDEAQRHLVQAERLAAIGQVVTGLAHESRNALQRSQANLDLLSLEVEDRPEAGELVHRIQVALAHLHHLYEEVRGYAAPIHLERRLMPLDQLWRQTWNNLEMNWAQKRLILVERVQCDSIAVHADSHAVERIFRNLLENAIFASPDDAEITVCAEPDVLGERAAIRIAVLDRGSGISGDAAGRVFEPFFTTKTHGTGLGLAITRRLVEAHGGTIELYRAAPQGTEAVVQLPRL